LFKFLIETLSKLSEILADKTFTTSHQCKGCIRCHSIFWSIWKGTGYFTATDPTRLG